MYDSGAPVRGREFSHVCSCVCCCSRIHGFSSACMYVTGGTGFTISPVQVLSTGGWRWQNGGYAATELPRALLPFFDRRRTSVTLSRFAVVTCYDLLLASCTTCSKLARPATGPSNCATWKRHSGFDCACTVCASTLANVRLRR